MTFPIWSGFVRALGLAGLSLFIFSACVSPGIEPLPDPPPDAAATENPFPASTAIIGEGEELYLAKCATCHGYAADGFGPQYQLYVPRPSDFTTDVFQAQTDGAIFWKAWNGNTDTAGTSADMAGLKHRGAVDKDITEDEIWKIVRFLRTAPGR